MAVSGRSLLTITIISIAVGPASPSYQENATPGGESRAERSLGPAQPDARLAHFLAMEPVAATRGVEEFRRGVELGRDARHVEAVAAFVRAGELMPHLRDWTAAFAADAAARAGDTARVRVLQKEMGSAFANEWGWLARVRARNRSGDRAGAIAQSLREANTVSSDHRRAMAYSTAGALELEAGDTAAARVTLAKAITAEMGAEGALDAARALAALPALNAGDKLLVGRTLLRHGEVSAGTKVLDAYIDARGGTAAQRAVLRLEIGRALYRSRSYADAERRLLALVELDPAAPVLSEALLFAGRAQLRQDETDRALRTFARAAAAHPQGAPAAEANFLIADLAQDAAERASARKHFAATAKTAGAPELRAVAQMRLGTMAFEAREFAAAAAVFDSLRSNASGSVLLQATYWSGRAHGALGHDSIARARYQSVWAGDPTSYYGLLAGNRIGASLSDIRFGDGLPRNPELAGRMRTAMARIDVLRTLGLLQAAAYEAQRVRAHFSGNLPALYELGEAYAANGEVTRAIRLGRDLLEVNGEWDQRLLRIVYPMPYREQIVAAAQRANVDPFLVAGLIRQESSFNPRARSGAGAIGLMQVMPRTGSILAKAEGIGSYDASRLVDPAINLRLGTRYLSDMIRRHNGIVETLAAYNAGPTPVSRWTKLPERRDEELFVERIPYEETRDYVRIVQQNARIYEALYKRGG